MAISLAQMRANFGGNDDLAREAYCGMEALVTTPDGRSKLLVVSDAFDDKWVLSVIFEGGGDERRTEADSPSLLPLTQPSPLLLSVTT